MRLVKNLLCKVLTNAKDLFGEEVGYGVFDSYVTKDYKHISRLTGGYIYGKE